MTVAEDIFKELDSKMYKEAEKFCIRQDTYIKLKIKYGVKIK